MIGELKQHLISLQQAIGRAEVFHAAGAKADMGVADFEKRKREYYEKAVSGYVNIIRKFSSHLPMLADANKGNETAIYQIQKLINELDSSTTRKKAVSQLINLCEDINEPQKEKIVQVPQNIPKEIAQDIFADLNELERCYDSACYRSAVILCGRLLETALHRKYYELTGKDLLEKAPGMGLGKVIAKLAERNVQFEPGLTQQIHLINQVRISSVHQKQDSFSPSQNQAKAMILYTIDVLIKLFKPKDLYINKPSNIKNE